MSSIGYVIFIFIFSGLIPFLIASEALGNGVRSIVANEEVLSNTVFPMDLVPVKAVLLSQFIMAVVMTVILAHGHLPLPVMDGTPPAGNLAITGFSFTGFVWIISLINLAVRDLQNLICLIVLRLMVASPIAYAPETGLYALKELILNQSVSFFRDGSSKNSRPRKISLLAGLC